MVGSSPHEAIENDEFYELLTGKRGYSIKILDASIKNDDDFVLVVTLGVFEQYKITQNDDIINKYQAAIKRLLNGTRIDVWSGFNVLFTQFSHEEQGTAPFKIDKNIASGLKDYLLNHKSEMEKTFPYSKREGNAYEDIMRLDNMFIKKYGYGLVV